MPAEKEFNGNKTAAVLPLSEVLDAMDLLGKDATGSLAAMFEYFREEWMTPNKLPLWNLLHLLIEEQGAMEALIQQVTSGRVTVNDLRVKNNKYDEVQLRITALSAEYDGGTRTMDKACSTECALTVVLLKS
ncbi:hypothetical protein T07_8760 [Trichinella nelsoni]|uniref:Uncharacterized protein n=1 Tax=Trichinella nelsoni TaxID=6336 RepID=A0A0V0RMG5_9BILA|nr:hypothetical protein T07_8760 [Trichinella nelsoni]